MIGDIFDQLLLSIIYRGKAWCMNRKKSDRLWWYNHLQKYNHKYLYSGICIWVYKKGDRCS